MAELRFKPTLNAKADFVGIVPCCFSYKVRTITVETICLKDIFATTQVKPYSNSSVQT